MVFIGSLYFMLQMSKCVYLEYVSAGNEKEKLLTFS